MADPTASRMTERTIVWQWAGVVALALLVAAFPVYRGVEAGRRAEALAQRESALVSEGRELWAANCASCHGADGASDEVGTPSLNSQQFLTSATDEQIHHVTAAGVPGTEMPAWWVEFGGALTDDQIRAVVAYIRLWESTAPDEPGWRNFPTTVAESEPTRVQEATEEPTDAPTDKSERAPAEPSPEPQENVVAITMDDVACEPLKFEVDAGRPVTIEVDNQGTGSYTFAIDALDLHEHAPPGQVTTIQLSLNQEGKYGFECLGGGHGSVLGVGVIRAR